VLSPQSQYDEIAPMAITRVGGAEDAGRDGEARTGNTAPKDGPGNATPKDGAGSAAPKDGTGSAAPEDGPGNEAPEDGPGSAAPKDGKGDAGGGNAPLVRKTKEAAAKEPEVAFFLPSGEENFYPDLPPEVMGILEGPAVTGNSPAGSYPFNLHTLVRQVHDIVSPLAESRGLIFSWYTAPTLPVLLEGDSPRLRGALILLLQSAVQAADGGAVQLSVRRNAMSSFEGDLLFSISDNGSAQRTDAGFFLAWELASRTGGAFTVDYSPAGGTRTAFTVRFKVLGGNTLPAGVSSPDFPSRSGGESAPPRLSGNRPVCILLAEMTGGARRQIARCLEGVPQTCFNAFNEDQLLHLAGEHAPALVIFDADMPEHDIIRCIAGLRADEAAQSRAPAAVMVLTGHDMQAARLLEAGAGYVLGKPFSREAFLDTLVAAVPASAVRIRSLGEAPSDGPPAVPKTPPGPARLALEDATPETPGAASEAASADEDASAGAPDSVEARTNAPDSGEVRTSVPDSGEARTSTPVSGKARTSAPDPAQVAVASAEAGASDELKLPIPARLIPRGITHQTPGGGTAHKAGSPAGQSAPASDHTPGREIRRDPFLDPSVAFLRPSFMKPAASDAGREAESEASGMPEAPKQLQAQEDKAVPAQAAQRTPPGPRPGVHLQAGARPAGSAVPFRKADASGPARQVADADPERAPVSATSPVRKAERPGAVQVELPPRHGIPPKKTPADAATGNADRKTVLSRMSGQQHGLHISVRPPKAGAARAVPPRTGASPPAAETLPVAENAGALAAVNRAASDAAPMVMGLSPEDVDAPPPNTAAGTASGKTEERSAPAESGERSLSDGENTLNLDFIRVETLVRDEKEADKTAGGKKAADAEDDTHYSPGSLIDFMLLDTKQDAATHAENLVSPPSDKPDGAATGTTPATVTTATTDAAVTANAAMTTGTTPATVTTATTDAAVTAVEAPAAPKVPAGAPPPSLPVPPHVGDVGSHGSSAGAPPSSLPVPLPGLDGEFLEQDVLPLLPGLTDALAGALRDAGQGMDGKQPALVQEAAARMASRAEHFGLSRLGRLARCLERAAEARDEEALRTIFEDLRRVAQQYERALMECFHNFVSIDG
jgi:CheY-like chemotaxis protein